GKSIRSARVELPPRSCVCDRSPAIVLSTGVSSVAHSVALQCNLSRDCTLISPRCRTAERPRGSGATTNRLAGWSWWYFLSLSSHLDCEAEQLARLTKSALHSGCV